MLFLRFLGLRQWGNKQINNQLVWWGLFTWDYLPQAQKDRQTDRLIRGQTDYKRAKCALPQTGNATK